MDNAKAEDTVNAVFYSPEFKVFNIYENIAVWGGLTATITVPANLAGTAVEA